MGQTRPLADLQAALRSGTCAPVSGLHDRLEQTSRALLSTGTAESSTTPRARAAALPDRLNSTSQTAAGVTPEPAWQNDL